MSKYLYVRPSLVLTGTSFDSSYQLQLSWWSFDRTLSLSVHVLVSYESVENCYEFNCKKVSSARIDQNSGSAIWNWKNTGIAYSIPPVLLSCTVLPDAGTPYRSHEGPTNRTSSWMIQNPNRREDDNTCKICCRLNRLVGNDLLKVEVDMWTDSYPEDFRYIYVGLLTSLVHYM